MVAPFTVDYSGAKLGWQPRTVLLYERACGENGLRNRLLVFFALPMYELACFVIDAFFGDDSESTILEEARTRYS